MTKAHAPALPYRVRKTAHNGAKSQTCMATKHILQDGDAARSHARDRDPGQAAYAVNGNSSDCVSALIAVLHVAGAEGVRSELAAVMYSYNVMGTRGPRKMTALIPQPDGGEDGSPATFWPQANANALIDR